MGGGLPNVDLPLVVQLVADVDGDPGQLVVLLLLEHPQPVACNQEPIVAEYVKTLLRIPPLRTGGPSVFVRGQLRLVRQDVRLDRNLARTGA
jgi:hypothetical protein